MTKKTQEISDSTGIANVIFDYWIGVLKNYQYKALMSIYYKTATNEKCLKYFSIDNLIEWLNISPSIAKKTIANLEERKLITPKGKQYQIDLYKLYLPEGVQ